MARLKELLEGEIVSRHPHGLRHDPEHIFDQNKMSGFPGHAAPFAKVSRDAKRSAFDVCRESAPLARRG